MAPPIAMPAAGIAAATVAASRVGVIVAPADAAVASRAIATSTASLIAVRLPLIPHSPSNADTGSLTGATMVDRAALRPNRPVRFQA